MTLVEDYSTEAVACITDILQSRVRRIGASHITSRVVSKIITERFGLNYGSVRFLTAYVIGLLVHQDKLRLWDSKPGTDVYKLVVENLE